MKLFAILFALISISANASSTVRLIHSCKNEIPDSNLSVHVQEADFTDMHGDNQVLTTVNVSQGWIGGTYASGTLGVKVIAAADGGPVVYVNEPMKFYLHVSSRGVNEAGRAAMIIVEGKFVDTVTGREIEIPKTKLSCR